MPTCLRPIPRIALVAAFSFCILGSAFGQWQIENSNTTADLRGIDNVGGGVAWASGTNGTVLRTEDGGYVWQRCAMPPGAEKLDFRGIQAFDANTAIVMSSGKGDLSRLYKTTDGCQTWKLVFSNPDKDGFWDAVHLTQDNKVYILGDPVRGAFAMFVSADRGDNWFAAGETGRDAVQGDGAFAASNSSLIDLNSRMLFGTGGGSSPHVYATRAKCSPPPNNPNGLAIFDCTISWSKVDAPVASGTLTSGIFSLAARPLTAKNGMSTEVVVAVGGVYDKPEDVEKTAARSVDGGEHWSPAQTPPHGYRSAVAYDTTSKTWITVGPNGTDISTDDGKNWRALKPDAARHETPDADRNWNALSLPFVVGPKGRIGKLNPAALAK